MRVGYLPYKPGGNPYQSLFAGALESVGDEVLRIDPAKWFPLQKACAVACDVLQLDWPHDWYRGRTSFSALVKQIMYNDGLRKLRSRPSVWTAHNLIAHDADNLDFEKRMVQKLIDVTDGIIVMSELARRELHEAYKVSTNTEIQVVPHGHYMDVYPNHSTRIQSRKKLKLIESLQVALSLGRIMPYKGFEELIEEFGQLDLENSMLVIAGSCSSEEYKRKLRGLAEKYNKKRELIRIVAEFIRDGDLQYYFNAADFAVLPFRNILNSGSLMLAMSFGKLVVAPRAGSIAEVVYPDGWIGYEPDCAGGLSDAITSAKGAFNPDLEARIKIYVENQYSWSNVGKLAHSLYERVC